MPSLRIYTEYRVDDLDGNTIKDNDGLSIEFESAQIDPFFEMAIRTDGKAYFIYIHESDLLVIADFMKNHYKIFQEWHKKDCIFNRPD